MAATPLLSLIKKGTFITFQSAAEDMNNVFAQSDANRKFVFSKFALLNIPHITDQQSTKQNNINFNNIEGHFVNGLNQNLSILERHRLDFCESFQNYLMNLETLITSQKTYDRTNPRTVSERIFFKWLKEIGAIRYQENASSNAQTKLFSEEESSAYNRIVQYVGEIDMQGSNSNTNENSFNEVYINVPSQAGNTPTVLFKSISDNNYNERTIIRGEGELIKGRNKNQNPTSAGLTIEAIYDQDVHHKSLNYENGWYTSKGIDNNNCYYTDPSFSDASNDVIKRETTDKGRVHTYKRSRLDGVSIDFDLSDYEDVVSYNKSNTDRILTFNQYNQLEKANNFDFNVILVYYDTYSVDNPSDSVTNLYGVLFVDDFKLDGNNAKIGTLTKIQQDNLINQQGNGIGFRLNFKFDVSNNTVDRKVEVSINDYNTFSMQMFMEAMNTVAAMNRNYETLLQYNQKLIEQNKSLQDIIRTLNLPEYRAMIEQYRSLPVMSNSNSGLNDIVSKLSQKVNEILAGKTTVEVVNNLSVNAKSGIEATFSDGMLTLVNTRQRYSTIHQVDFDVFSKNNYAHNIIQLGVSDTLVIHSSEFDQKVAANHLMIRIDDSVNGWSVGQTFTIVFDKPIDFGSFGVILYTDAKNVSQEQSEYSKTVGIITEIKSKSPIIEVTCINPSQYKFIVTNK